MKKTNKQLHLLLVYPDFIEGDTIKKTSGGSYSEGVASISAVIKAAGYKVSLMHINHEFKEKEYKARLKEYKDIDLIGFSTRTTMFEYNKDLVKWTRDVNKTVFTFVGSYHAILAPEDFINYKGLDAVCIGEGEYPLRDLMDKMKDNKDYTKTLSFWFFKGKDIIKNAVRPLIEDLDELPFPDIDLFDYKNLDTTKTDTALILLSRGCLYSCTYCGNGNFRNIYPNKAKYARFRSPEKSIELIKNILKEYPNIKYINFRDAIINMYKDWFDKFMELYTKEIKLPFTCNLRFDIVSEDTVKRMKEAGCYTIDIGLESGNEEIRHKYLHRFTTDEQMINCSNWFNKYKITVLTYNILGLPYEDLHKALETVKLNAKLKSNQIIPNIFYPYPATELKKTAEEAGFLREITPKTKVFIKQPQFPDHQVLFAADYFMFFVKKYKWCYKEDTKARHIIEKFWDFVFVGPLTPRHLLVFLAEGKKKFRNWLKMFVINHMPALYQTLRNKKNNIRKSNINVQKLDDTKKED
ncbi:MAG: radical SAM protein [Bacilli bacterium]